MFEPIHKLTNAGLRDLAALCRQRSRSSPPPTHALQQLAGATLGDELRQCLRSLIDQGWGTDQFAMVIDAIAESRQKIGDPDDLFDLVLSGPEAPGICTRDTAAVMHALLSEARNEVLLVG